MSGFSITSQIQTPDKEIKAGQELFKNLYSSYFTGGNLGVFTEPLLNFVATYNTLRKNNPELKEQPAAATAYFSMLSETPVPTTGETAKIPTSILNETEKIDPYQMLGKDGYFIVYGDGVNKVISRDGLQEMPAADAYFFMVARLQKFLSKMGLTEGIQKTLNEQSRKAQAAQAQAQGSKAAAAYAAAMAQKAAEEVTISREEAAEAIAKANKEFEEAVAAEAAEQKKLQNIAAGLPADFDEKAGLKKWLVIGGIAAAGFLLLRKRG